MSNELTEEFEEFLEDAVFTILDLIENTEDMGYGETADIGLTKTRITFDQYEIDDDNNICSECSLWMLECNSGKLFFWIDTDVYKHHFLYDLLDDDTIEQIINEFMDDYSNR